VRNRVEEYLERENVRNVSLKEAMDLFLPEALEPPFDEVAQFWMSIPMLRQPQFGPYLHDSALLTMTEAAMSKEFKVEWAMRICRLMLYDLRGRPTNKRLQQTTKKRRGRCADSICREYDDQIQTDAENGRGTRSGDMRCVQGRFRRWRS
jgi:hypothetical protein